MPGMLAAHAGMPYGLLRLCLRYSMHSSKMCTRASFITAMLREIAAARHHVHLDYYIFLDDAVGTLVADVLMDKARQGVEVRLIVDDLGCWKVKEKSFARLREAGVEVVKFNQIVTPENYHEYIRFASDSPEMNKIMDPEHPVTAILASAHLGNWELAGNIYAMLSGQNLCSIMRPLANRKLGEYFYTHRMSKKHTTVSKEKGIRPLLAALNRGDSIAVVSDQHATKTEGVEITFFGHPARAHMTVALLHLKTGHPILPILAIREDDNFHFMLTGTAPIRYTPTGNKEHDIREITQLYSNGFEELIRKYPEQWLWAHRRWLDCNRNHKHKDNEHDQEAGHGL